MKKHNTKERRERNIKIAKMYLQGAYTARGLAKIFRISHPRILAIARKYGRNKKGRTPKRVKTKN